jgi:hypothetical protein
LFARKIKFTHEKATQNGRKRFFTIFIISLNLWQMLPNEVLLKTFLSWLFCHYDFFLSLSLYFSQAKLLHYHLFLLFLCLVRRTEWSERIKWNKKADYGEWKVHYENF